MLIVIHNKLSSSVYLMDGCLINLNMKYKIWKHFKNNFLQETKICAMCMYVVLNFESLRS